MLVFPAPMILCQRPFSTSWLKLSFKNTHQLISLSLQNPMVASSSMQEEMQTCQWYNTFLLPGACLPLRHSLCHTCSVHKDAVDRTSLFPWTHQITSCLPKCSFFCQDPLQFCMAGTSWHPCVCSNIPSSKKTFQTLLFETASLPSPTFLCSPT